MKIHQTLMESHDVPRSRERTKIENSLRERLIERERAVEIESKRKRE